MKIVIQDLVSRIRGNVLVVAGSEMGCDALVGRDLCPCQIDGMAPLRVGSSVAFARQPLQVWNWYLDRIRESLRMRPTAAHLAIAELDHVARKVTVVTVNVDSLQQLAGSRRVFRLHGNLYETLCPGCGRIDPVNLRALPREFGVGELPQCPTCHALLRPNVVWCGELPNMEPFQVLQDELPRADLVIEVGFPNHVSYGFTNFAVRAGKTVLKIHPSALPHSDIIGTAEDANVVLPRLMAAAM